MTRAFTTSRGEERQPLPITELRRASIMLAICLALCAIQILRGIEVAAEPLRLEVAGGATHFYKVNRDNYWYQAPFPYEHSLDSTAWRVGVSYKFSDEWVGSISWLNLGSVGVRAKFVTDPQYTNCLNGDHGLRGCGAPLMRFDIKSANYGPEFAMRRDFRHTYLRGGAFLWIFDFEMQGEDARGRPFRNDDKVWWGWRLAPFVGAGLKYKNLFAEVNYYHAMGGIGGFPIAKRALVPMVGIQIPIGK